MYLPKEKQWYRLSGLSGAKFIVDTELGDLAAKRGLDLTLLSPPISINRSRVVHRSDLPYPYGYIGLEGKVDTQFFRYELRPPQVGEVDGVGEFQGLIHEFFLLLEKRGVKVTEEAGPPLLF